MTPEEIIEFSRASIFALLKVSLPLLLVALIVGLIIALFQALTQIQEMTLTFVPKILTIFIVLLFLMPYIGAQFNYFAQSLFSLIGR